jgi:TRAP-type mannitol/chloroaromatic compound transport system permease small subunit
MPIQRDGSIGGNCMPAMLALSRMIDTINERLGKAMGWLILAAVIVSSVNALVRFSINRSSNSWLELQWYLFGAVVLLGAAYTFKANEHIRIDILSSRLSQRSRDWIDVVGHLLFMMPLCLIIMWLGWPFFLRSFAQGEVSSSAGGLIVWPAKLLVPLGFTILFVQSISELIKRIAVIKGLIADPHGDTAGAHGTPVIE